MSVPDGVVPGVTPGWPVDVSTGRPLDLTDEQRAAIAEVHLKAAKVDLPVAGDAHSVDHQAHADLIRDDPFLGELAHDAEPSLEGPKVIVVCQIGASDPEDASGMRTGGFWYAYAGSLGEAEQVKAAIDRMPLPDGSERVATVHDMISPATFLEAH